MNRDLPTTTEGIRTRAMRAHSLIGNLCWLLPPAAALFYPQAVRALYESGKLLDRASGPVVAVAWLATALAVGLIYGVPAVSIGVAFLLGRHERTSSAELLVRRLAHRQWPLLRFSCSLESSSIYYTPRTATPYFGRSCG